MNAEYECYAILAEDREYQNDRWFSGANPDGATWCENFLDAIHWSTLPSVDMPDAPPGCERPKLVHCEIHVRTRRPEREAATFG